MKIIIFFLIFFNYYSFLFSITISNENNNIIKEIPFSYPLFKQVENLTFFS